MFFIDKILESCDFKDRWAMNGNKNTQNVTSFLNCAWKYLLTSNHVQTMIKTVNGNGYR